MGGVRKSKGNRKINYPALTKSGLGRGTLKFLLISQECGEDLIREQAALRREAQPTVFEHEQAA